MCVSEKSVWCVCVCVVHIKKMIADCCLEAPTNVKAYQKKVCERGIKRNWADGPLLFLILRRHFACVFVHLAS